MSDSTSTPTDPGQPVPPATGPGAPEYTTYTPVPPATPHSRPTGLIAAVAVLLAGVLGVGGWLVLAPRLALAGQPTSTPAGGITSTPTPAPSAPTPANPTTPAPSEPAPAPRDPMAAAVPFDPAQGLSAAADESFAVVGVWDGVAVIRLANPVTGDTLRGFDITTGAVLWTVSHLPDGSAFVTAESLPNSSYAEFAVASNGKLALALDAPVSPGASCPSATYLAVVSLATGDVSAVHSFDPGCGAWDDGTPKYQVFRLAAYQEGMIVGYLWQPIPFPAAPVPILTNGTFTKTVAFVDTDLTTPAWTVDQQYEMAVATDAGKIDNSATNWEDSDKVLWDRLVLTSAGTYADLKDGTLSTFSLRGDAKAPGGRSFRAVGGVVVESTSRGEHLVEYGAMSMWASPSDTVPAWTFTPGPDGYLDSIRCLSPDVLVVDAVAPTSEVVGLDVRSGTPRWTVASPAEDGAWYDNSSCVIVTPHTTPLVEYVGDGAVRVFDATTGAGPYVVDLRGVTPEDYYQSGAYPCADGMTCAVYYNTTALTVSLSLSAIDTTDPTQPSVAWTVGVESFPTVLGYPAVYPVTGGIVVVGSRDDGTYVFLNLTGK